MNRQLKRANEKSDKRREREQARRKEQRRASRVRVTKAKDTPKKDTPKAESNDGQKDARPAPGTRRPGLAGLYLLVVIGVVAAQALVPPQTDAISLVIHVLFYLILGYFLSLWFYRRGVEQAFVIALVGGLLLAFGVEGLKVALPQTEPNLLFAYLALPGLLPGAWLGRFIFRRNR